MINRYNELRPVIQTALILGGERDMSLEKAVLAIADDLDKEANNEDDWIKETRRVFASYAKQLRLAVKAAEGEAKPQLIIPTTDDPFAG